MSEDTWTSGRAYFERCRARGKPDEEIRKALAEAGWRERDIADLEARLQSTQSSRPAQRAELPDDWMSLLRSAVQRGDVEATVSLLDRGADANAWNSPDGWTPLRCAVEGGNTELVAALLDHGAGIIAWRRQGISEKAHLDDPYNPHGVWVEDGHPLAYAYDRRDWAVLRLLLMNGADINQPVKTLSADGKSSPTKHTLLCSAILQGKQDLAEQLFELGADLLADCDLAAGKSCTLRNAAERETTEWVTNLVTRYCDGETVRRFRERALRTAAARGDLAWAKRLLETGAHEGGDETLGPLLHDAIDSGSEAMVTLMLQAGADPNEPAQWSTPLCQAAFRNSVPIIELLIAAGVDVTGETGAKAAYQAVSGTGRSVETVKFLLAKGAQPTLVPEDDVYRQTPKRHTAKDLDDYDQAEQILRTARAASEPGT